MHSTPHVTNDASAEPAEPSSATATFDRAQARLERSLRRCLALAVFLFAAYFSGGAAANQNARLDAIYAFAEPGTPDTGTFRIDRFVMVDPREVNTIDWAFHGGHYYANKAPGTLWLGAVAYKLLLLVEPWLGLAFDAPRVVLANAYLINLAASVLPLVLAALCLFSLARGLGVGPARAAWVALAISLGTLWFPYSTQLWGHTTAAAFTSMALLFVQRGSRRSVAFAGFFAGMAVCSDYLALLSALAVSVWLVCSRPKLVPYLLLGAAPAALALMLYHTLCFGGPLVTASQLSNPEFLDKDRALGLFGAFSGSAAWSLSFGIRRGLLNQCPVLLLCGSGFYQWIKRSPREALPYVCLGTSLLYLFVNASFNGWHGGATVGARYLICALPFLGLALHALPATRRMRRWSTGLLALSCLNMLAIAAVNPLAPDGLRNPLYGYTYALLLMGRVSPYPFSLRTLDTSPEWVHLHRFAMWNVGELLGLHGLQSLIPLLLCAALLAVWCRRALRLAAEASRADLPAGPASLTPP